MLVLRFNHEKFANDFANEMVEAAREAFNVFMTDAMSGLDSTDQELKDAILDMGKEKISSSCIFYAQSILRSYGRGRQMDKSNEYLQDYMNSSLWNPAREKRPGAQIVGRPKGNYTNILGQTAYSTGEKEGKVTAIPVGNVVQPTYSIQNAEKKLERGLMENGYVYRIFRRHTNDFFSSMNPARYFYNDEVKQ